MATAAQFVAKCESQLGVPYKWGGTSPQEGFDCSGLVYWACQQLAIPGTPRTSQAQWAALQRVSPPQYGDLVFFDVPSDGPYQPGHVGVYLSPGRMIDAPETGEDVSIQPFPFPGGTVMGYGRPRFTAPAPPIPPQEDEMPFIAGDGTKTWLVDGGVKIYIPMPTDVQALEAIGIKNAGTLSTGFMAGIPVAT